MANDVEMMLEVEIFDGSGNFTDWTEQVILALRQKGVLDYAESDMRVGTAEEPDKKKFSNTDSKADGLAVAIILRCLSKSHRKRFIRSIAFEVWTELHKLYGIPNPEDLMSNILELFSFRMDLDDKEGHASAVQYSNLLDKIDFMAFSSSAMANLMYLASLNKHHDLVHLEFTKKKPNELEFDDIFNAVCALSDTHKKQRAYDEKIGVTNFGGAARAQRPTCKHCR
ncbi:hypothetical protein IW139_004770 [Coemansia sp. RSA 353]|nr:hypothetical protein GGH17_001731 [Coemansia sp. RSA 788]KAJ2171774.1 hypothetical protein GGH16_002676 [Coemansia sp. RSA 560]KAJ2184206.1 hypothetical protein EV181_004501 [Coemansia sp. RSA 532]KAJ2191884.1 hypothetical protein IW144_005131 [Coemansia sp. RSA 522]KAJ2194183.1 hypothetical protein GGH18_002304 [Coemansia sp. RSA 530]KAJ2204461.1 hypothetical protein IW145_003422 [Coemansia sp. RSA 521]KAJ2221686.1 hypothetical protein IW143_001728 [Coemansia sp. RSA 520]KAJ2223915.1 hyp